MNVLPLSLWPRGFGAGLCWSLKARRGVHSADSRREPRQRGGCRYCLVGDASFATCEATPTRAAERSHIHSVEPEPEQPGFLV
jgi:hypothetical protein